jgi:hypothetical protein
MTDMAIGRLKRLSVADDNAMKLPLHLAKI